MLPAQVLELLREQGWHQGDFAAKYADPDRPGLRPEQWRQTAVCVLGAASLVLTDHHEVGMDMRGSDELAEVCGVIVEQYPEFVGFDNGLGLIASWNDAPSTTFADVESVLEKAEVRCSEGDSAGRWSAVS